MRLWWNLVAILTITANFVAPKRTIGLHKKQHKLRQSIEEAPDRNEDRGEDGRNITTVHDSVHKYHGKGKLASSAKRHYLGLLNGLERIHADNKQHNGLNGFPTADLGVHANAPNVGYLDAVHGVAAGLHGQKLQIGIQPDQLPEQHGEGLSPLPIYNKREPSLSIDPSVPSAIPQHLGQHERVSEQLASALNHLVGMSASNNIATGSSDTDGHSLAGASAPNELHFDQTVAPANLPVVAGWHNEASTHGSSQLSDVLQQANKLDQYHLPSHDHVFHDEKMEALDRLIHHDDQYLHGSEDVQHELSKQEPYVINNPPIHTTKTHYHQSFQTVEDEGKRSAC